MKIYLKNSKVLLTATGHLRGCCCTGSCNKWSKTSADTLTRVANNTDGDAHLFVITFTYDKNGSTANSTGLGMYFSGIGQFLPLTTCAGATGTGIAGTYSATIYIPDSTTVIRALPYNLNPSQCPTALTNVNITGVTCA